MPGPQLDPGHPVTGQQPGDQRPGRGEVLDPPDPARSGTPRGIAEHRRVSAEQGLRQHLGVAQHHLGAAPEVEPRHGRRVRVALHRDHLEPGCGAGQRVAADAATEVHHPPYAGRDVAGRMVGGHLRPGGLLETDAGEVHLGRGQTELGPPAAPQLGLSQRRGREVGGEPGAEQLGGGQRGRVGLPVGQRQG